MKSATFKQLERAIRRQCIACFGGSRAGVEGCTSPGCSLYPYRLGVKMKFRRSNPVKNLSEKPLG